MGRWDYPYRKFVLLCLMSNTCRLAEATFGNLRMLAVPGGYVLQEGAFGDRRVRSGKTWVPEYCMMIWILP